MLYFFLLLYLCFWSFLHHIITKKLITIKLYRYDYELRIQYFEAILDRKYLKALGLLIKRRWRVVYQKKYAYILWVLFFLAVLGIRNGLILSSISLFFLLAISCVYWILVFIMDSKTRGRSDIKEVNLFLSEYFPE